MTPKVNRDKSFLLEWIILHGDNWVFHNDIDMASYRFDICRKEKYIEETKCEDIQKLIDNRKSYKFLPPKKDGRKRNSKRYCFNFRIK